MNNFIENIEQALDITYNAWHNETVGNYWDDYSEKFPDATSIDGIWRNPYFITMGNNRDRFPVVDAFVLS